MKSKARSYELHTVGVILMVIAIAGQVASLPVVAEPDARTGPADPVLDAALSYLNTLYASNFDRLETLLTPDARFDDPTATALLGRSYAFSGRDQILDRFANSASGSRDAGFEVRSSFTSGDRAILTLTYHSVIDGDWFGRPGFWIPIRVPAVTILRIVDGKVAEHIDHVDYDELVRQVRAY